MMPTLHDGDVVLVDLDQHRARAETQIAGALTKMMAR